MTGTNTGRGGGSEIIISDKLFLGQDSFDRRYEGHEDATANTATKELADDDSNSGGRICATSHAQHAQDLSAQAAAYDSGNTVSDCS